MDIIEQLLKLRKRIIESTSVKKESKNENLLVSQEKDCIDGLTDNISDKQVIEKKENSTICLNDKIEAFINWYSQNMSRNNHNDDGLYCDFKANFLKNFIEKMAVWYELRYPDYEINRLMPCMGQEEKSINNIMFEDNKYVRDLLDENSDIKALDWEEFYNAHAFISSLPFEEKQLFKSPKYFNIRNGNARVQLTPTGIIKGTEKLGTLIIWLNDKERANIDEQFIGKHIEDLLEFIKKRGDGKVYDSLKQIVDDYKNKIYLKEEILNCVMYRIIERGGNRIGPRRAFLFAKEFDRNIDIPMMYGVDQTDPGLRLFINEYLKSGGSKDLICYVGYFSRYIKCKKLDTISIQNLIFTQPNNAFTFYTPEEDELHQRLVNVLNNQVDYNDVKQEKVKQLRLERKIEKSKK